MKKIFSILLISFILLAGCGASSLEKISSNLNTYNLDITFYDDNTLDIKENFEFKNTFASSLDTLYFHNYPASFCAGVVNSPVGVLSKAKAYPNGESYGTYNFVSIASNNNNLSYELIGTDKDIIKVSLPKAITKNETIKIDFVYSLIMPNIAHRYGFGDETINLANFYPILAVFEENEWVLDGYHYNGDPFYSEMANYIVKIKANSKYTLASSGELINKTQEESNVIYNIRGLVIRDFAFVLSEKFEVISETINNVTINYFYYDDDNASTSLKTAVDSVSTFTKLFGEYPYKTLNVVKCNFVHGGMEYPNLIYISDEVTELENYINVIVHETAHQWWYGVVGNNEYKYPWLDEGLTEYSTVLFYMNNPEYNVNTSELIKNSIANYVTFVDLYTSVLNSVDTTMNRSLNDYNTEPEYVYITYVKGMLMFDTLKDTVGYNKFIKALQTYYNSNKYTNATPDDLYLAFKKSTGENLENFFASWINGKVNIISNS